MTIGETIKKKRVERGLSREKLAWEAKVTSQSIMSIEKDIPTSIRILSKVCDVLGFDICLSEREERILSDTEVCVIVENIAEAVINDNKYACFSIEDRKSVV